MKKRIITLVAIVGLTVSAVGSAGEVPKKMKKKRCSAEADVCLRAMTEKLKSRGWIGIEMEKGEGRQIVTKVIPGSPAERAGLAPGDAIVAFNGVALSEGEETVYAEIKKALVPGREITLAIERSGARSDVAVTLVEVPRELVAQWIGKHMLEQHAEAEEERETAADRETSAPKS